MMHGIEQINGKSWNSGLVQLEMGKRLASNIPEHWRLRLKFGTGSPRYILYPVMRKIRLKGPADKGLTTHTYHTKFLLSGKFELVSRANKVCNYKFGHMRFHIFNAGCVRRVLLTIDDFNHKFISIFYTALEFANATLCTASTKTPTIRSKVRS
jgi:hypothetical protein